MLKPKTSIIFFLQLFFYIIALISIDNNIIRSIKLKTLSLLTKKSSKPFFDKFQKNFGLLLIVIGSK